MALIPGMVVATIVPTLASSVAMFKLAAATFALIAATAAVSIVAITALAAATFALTEFNDKLA